MSGENEEAPNPSTEREYLPGTGPLPFSGTRQAPPADLKPEDSLAILRAVFETVEEGIVATDMAGKVTVYNQRFLSLWQVDASVAGAGSAALMEACERQVKDPAAFRQGIEEIFEKCPPNTRDFIDFKDGRVFTRWSRVQIVDGTPAGRVWTFRDITDQRRADRLLLEQGEWFTVTLASIGDAVITVDTERRVTFINSVAESLTGLTQAQARGLTVDEVMPIFDERRGIPAISPVAAVLEHGKVVALANHTVLVRRDGARIPIEDSAAPIRNSAGEIIGVVMVFHDVTDRRRKDEALEASEERFRLLGEVVPQFLWTTDPAGGVDFMNERWYDYTGQTARTALGGGWLDALHPEDRERAAEVWRRAVSGPSPYEVEYRLRGQEGTYRWFVARGVPLRDGDGTVIRWYGSCTDVDQLRATAAALAEESAMTEQLYGVARALATELDLGKVVQIITDAGTRITRAAFGAFFYNVLDGKGASYMLYTLSGVPREAFEKFPMPRATHLFGPTFRGEGAVRAADIRKDPRFGKNPPHHGMPAGHLPVVSYLAVPVVARTGEVLGGLFFGHPEEDVFTARDEEFAKSLAAHAAAAMDSARLYQSAQEARAAAELASQTKDDFLAALSHELRTPLTPVLAILSSIRQDATLPPQVLEDIQRAERNVELEARLIDDLLDLTRVTRGKLELQCELLTPASIVEDALGNCRADLEAKQLSFLYEGGKAEAAVWADRARVSQILWNLLKNAVKFTPPGGTVTIRSHVTETGQGDCLVLEVEDTGIGIERENLERVFEAFEQGGRSITRQFGGLGLGLAISRAIARAHQGTLRAESDGPGKGSTFILTLPLHQSTPPGTRAPEPVTITSATAPPSPSRRLRILLVEDHKDSALTMCELLRRSGWEVAHASNVTEARDLAAKAAAELPFDLVISDLGLPDGSGLDLMRHLSAAHGLRGIALSGYGMSTDLKQSAEAGFSRHLVKPVKIAMLREAVTELAAEINRP